MSLSGQERQYWRRLTSAIDARDSRAGETPDFFHQAAASERRKTHLEHVIGRLAQKLKIECPANLHALDESQLEEIRTGLSKRVAQSKVEVAA